MNTTKDIFQKIAERDAAPKARKVKLVKRYPVSINGKFSSKLFERRQAQRIVSRAVRMGADAYLPDPIRINVAA